MLSRHKKQYTFSTKLQQNEGQFEVPLGMAYNSYVIIDDKIAVMDSVDRNFGSEWLKNIDGVLEEKKPDYLIVQHMEMDHSANVLSFMQKFPEAKIAGSKMAFTMMKNMFGTVFSDRQIVISEGSKIELEKHTLNFITAPNVHWPEVIMTYEFSEADSCLNRKLFMGSLCRKRNDGDA